MTMADFRLNDPVTIESTSSAAAAADNPDTSSASGPLLLLEGIVAHLGPVQFAPGNDWVGIRLTGSSVGKGKNDGSVKGVSYFDAGSSSSNNGMFVKKNVVKKRILSRLEELRLRRELSEAGAGAASASGASNVRGGVTSSSDTATGEGVRTRSRALKSPVAGSSGSSSSAVLPSGGATTPRKSVGASPPATSEGGKGGGTSKLEELRAKREALARERGSNSAINTVRNSGVSSTPSTSTTDAKEVPNDDEIDEKENNVALQTQEDASVSSSQPTINLQSATPGYRAELSRLQSKISNLEADLKKKTMECTSLQSSLDFMSRGAEQSTHDAVRMYAMGALALTEAKRSTPMTASRGNNATTTPGIDTPGKGGRRSLDAELKLEESNKGGGDENSCSDTDKNDEDDNDDEEEEGDTENEVINQAAAAVSTALVERNNELKQQLSDLTSANINLQNQLIETEERISNITSRFEQATENYRNEKQARSDEAINFNAEKSVLMSQISSLERELKVVQERVSDKSSMQDHSHAALAKLRAEITTLQRKTEELENDKMELESTLEELVLDKEQIGQEKEMLEDQLEEMKIDLESAQLELEDAKAQLESDRAAEESAFDSADTAAGGGGAPPDATSSTNTADSQDVTRSLTLQNTRLRTALIRLREQSELERNQLQRQIKSFQTESTNRDELQAELDTLKSKHASTLSEVKELKDMIDQTSALEETIETLSDKVWNLEELNADLNRTIRELEESAEIAAEMEEVQAEEIKMLLRELEGRDAHVHNLEEAIRMQRRREEDFQRYVSEFRASISTLKQENAALLAHTDSDQGEKSHLLATSKKALAQAAQLASDATEARRNSSEAMFLKISARSATYLSQRLELMLPSAVVSAELAAVKGELSLAKVADMASASLVSLEEIFNKSIEKGSAAASEFNTIENNEPMALSDAASQRVAVMAHQGNFARIAIEVATDALRLMAAGQWPKLLSQELATDLGGVMAHTIADLDMALSEQLKLLKSEGVLSPMRSSLSYLDQSARNTSLALFSVTDESGQLVIPTEWKPPGWEALKYISLGRFACLGAAAVLSSAVCPNEDMSNEPPPATPKNFAEVLTKTKECCSFMHDVCKNLTGLQLNDTDKLHSLNDLSIQFHNRSKGLYDYVTTAFEGQSITSEDVHKFSSQLEMVLSSAKHIASLIRKSNVDEHTHHHHYLSVEFGDSWGGIIAAASQARILDDGSEDVNYLMRARAVENKLAEAVNNEPKLVAAKAEIASLEKSLSSRAKEILIQQQNLAELETLLARTASANSLSPVKGLTLTTPYDSSGDTRKLTEEVHQLQEALDMAHKQSDEYAKEIRMLKDKSRTPRGVRTAGGKISPKKSSSMNLEATLTQLGQSSTLNSTGSTSRDMLLESISLEAALFRPALSSAMQSSSYWKAKAMGSALSKLAPLNVSTAAHSFPTSTCDEARHILGDLFSLQNRRNPVEMEDEIGLARNQLRLTNASLSIVDLSKHDGRAQLNRERRKKQKVELRLQNATSCC